MQAPGPVEKPNALRGEKKSDDNRKSHTIMIDMPDFNDDNIIHSHPTPTSTPTHTHSEGLGCFRKPLLTMGALVGPLGLGVLTIQLLSYHVTTVTRNPQLRRRAQQAHHTHNDNRNEVVKVVTNGAQSVS